MLDKLIKKTSVFLKLKEENILLKKEIELIKERLRLKTIDDDNIYYQRYIALSLALEGKTGDFSIGDKCPMCHLDKRLHGIPVNALDFLTEKCI